VRTREFYKVLKLKVFLNIASLVVGLLGTLLLFFFGIPNPIREDGASFLMLEGPDESEIKKAKVYRPLSNIGLLMLSASYALPLIATWLPE
jgi:hypothetical protein